MLWALLLLYSAACPGRRARPGPGTSSPVQGQLGSSHSSWLESDLQECFHLRQRVLLPLSPSHVPSGACGCCRPMRDLVGPQPRDAEGVMFQCPENSFLAQLQPLSPCVLSNAQTGCTAGTWKLLVCGSCWFVETVWQRRQ